MDKVRNPSNSVLEPYRIYYIISQMNPTSFTWSHLISQASDCATLQADSLFPTAGAGVTSQVVASGICGGQSDTGADLRVLLFPLPILIPPTAPYSLMILS
jgi:hypothetical protein